LSGHKTTGQDIDALKKPDSTHHNHQNAHDCQNDSHRFCLKLAARSMIFDQVMAWSRESTARPRPIPPTPPGSATFGVLLSGCESDGATSIVQAQAMWRKPRDTLADLVSAGAFVSPEDQEFVARLEAKVSKAEISKLQNPECARHPR
jgi:hypothetical protein